ncbi:hypothetical protein GCM10020001_066750 [Nonomuraea salmonea]
MAGGALTFLAVLILGPVLVRPLSAVVGWVPRRSFGVPGKLAVENSVRNPRRAATTTVALTIGVTLMTLISVITASTRLTMTAKLDEQFPVDYLLVDQEREPLIPRSVGEELRTRPELASVGQIRRVEAGFGGRTQSVGTFAGHVEPYVTAGSLRGFAAGQVAVDERTAARLGLRLGGTATLATQRAGTVSLRIVALLDGDQTMLPSVTVPERAFDAYFGAVPDTQVLVTIADGVPAARARAVVDAATAPLSDRAGQQRDRGTRAVRRDARHGADDHDGAARARHPHLVARHRQHAVVVRPRTHPRVRPAARPRPDPAAVAPHAVRRGAGARADRGAGGRRARARLRVGGDAGDAGRLAVRGARPPQVLLFVVLSGGGGGCWRR